MKARPFDLRRVGLPLAVVACCCAAGCGARTSSTNASESTTNRALAVVNDLRLVGVAAHNGLVTNQQPPQRLYGLVRQVGRLPRRQAIATLRSRLPSIARAERGYAVGAIWKLEALDLVTSPGRSGRSLELWYLRQWQVEIPRFAKEVDTASNSDAVVAADVAFIAWNKRFRVELMRKVDRLVAALPPGAPSLLKRLIVSGAVLD